jgi:GT2 family glycosyltransferase
LVLGREVTIATAAYGNEPSTRLCLEALFRSVSGEYQLLLIDDCSPDSGAIQSLYQKATTYHANTQIFKFERNLEYSGSVNAILSHATGEWVFFISNDIFVTPSYLRTLLAAAQANPKSGILRGSSNHVDNGFASHNIAPTRSITNLDDLFLVGREIEEMHGQSTQPDPFLVGDAFLVTRRVIDRIGAFDPIFFGYFADPDYGLRAQVAGFDLTLVPGAYAYHKQDANFDYLPAEQKKGKIERRWMRVFENWARFKLKWGMAIEQPYESISEIPWAQLAARPFDSRYHYSAPVDYTQYRIYPGPGA